MGSDRFVLVGGDDPQVVALAAHLMGIALDVHRRHNPAAPWVGLLSGADFDAPELVLAIGERPSLTNYREGDEVVALISIGRLRNSIREKFADVRHIALDDRINNSDLGIQALSLNVADACIRLASDIVESLNIQPT